jgi:hypothetical protein
MQPRIHVNMDRYTPTRLTYTRLEIPHVSGYSDLSQTAICLKLPNDGLAKTKSQSRNPEHPVAMRKDISYAC